MRVVTTIALVAGCWAVWEYCPVLLEFLGLDDLDIPGRVGAVFVFLTMVEAVATQLPRP